jgi:hypothetical protein
MSELTTASGEVASGGSDRVPRSPSLVKNVQSSAQAQVIKSLIPVVVAFVSPWSHQQKRIFHRMFSWLKEKQGQCRQLLRVDLTTGSDGDASKLRRHFAELKRRIFRVYGLRFEHFIVETCEGNGVLHMIWAFDQKNAVWIGQDWLSSEWLKIHGAHRVWIQRMGSSTSDCKAVTRYCVTQYLVKQGDGGSALVRYSWSWWSSAVSLSKGWSSLKGFYRFANYYHRRELRRSDLSLDERLTDLPFKSVFVAWDELLARGWTFFHGSMLIVSSRDVVEYGRVNASAVGGVS